MQNLELYNRLADRLELPPMQAGFFRVETQSVDQPDALETAIAGFAPQQGWVQYQSWQGLFDRELPGSDSDRGLLLCGEMVNGKGETLTVGPDGRGGWILSRVSHDEQGEGAWDEVVHLAHEGARALRYRRYWKEDAEQGWLQVRAALVGVETNTEE